MRASTRWPHWTSREATSASEVPESLAVVGGGAVGCELAQLYARLGARVTLVQNGPRLLPRVDADAAELLQARFREEGIDLRLGAKANRVEGGSGEPYRLAIEGEELVEAERLLVATGRRPNVEGFGFERLDLTVERQGIVVDETLAAGEGVWGPATSRLRRRRRGRLRRRESRGRGAGRRHRGLQGDRGGHADHRARRRGWAGRTGRVLTGHVGQPGRQRERPPESCEGLGRSRLPCRLSCRDRRRYISARCCPCKP